MAEVSVIVPNYNHGSYLKQRIESILAQTYQDFEIILMDDHSTDDSWSILTAYASHPKVVACVYNEENSGSPFGQWERGFSLASGRYVWIAESDDWCEPGFLAELVQGISQDDHTVIAFAQSIAINAEGIILWRSFFPRLTQSFDGIEFIRLHMLTGNSIPNMSMAIFRRSVLDKINFTGTKEFALCGDWYFWIQLMKRGKVFVSGKPLNYFRKHGDDVSGKNYATGRNFVEEISILTLLLKEGLIDSARFQELLSLRHERFVDHKSRGIINQEASTVEPAFFDNAVPLQRMTFRYRHFKVLIKALFRLR